jgi:hypothetical protein
MDEKTGFPCYGCVTLNSRGCLLRAAGLESDAGLEKETSPK